MEYLNAVPQNEPDFMDQQEEEAAEDIVSDSKMGFDDINSTTKNKGTKYVDDAFNIVEDDQIGENQDDQSVSISQGPPLDSDALDEDVGLDDIQQEEFGTMRMKKLISAIISEFKPDSKNFILKPEEVQEYMEVNKLQKNTVYAQFNLDNDNDEEVKRNNFHILGLNGEDLRRYIILAYQQQLADFEQQNPLFDLLEFPTLTMEDPSVLRYPFNKSKKLIGEV